MNKLQLLRFYLTQDKEGLRSWYRILLFVDLNLNELEFFAWFETK